MWSVDLSLGHTTVKFKIDTGAGVSVIPESVYLRAGLVKLWNASREQLNGLEKSIVLRILKTINSKETLQEIYVVEDLKEPLLGRPAIDALDLVHKVERIHSDCSKIIEAEVKANHPRLLKGLGELRREFTIKLKPGSTPFALTTSRRVALPLMKKLKKN